MTLKKNNVEDEEGYSAEEREFIESGVECEYQEMPEYHDETKRKEFGKWRLMTVVDKERQQINSTAVYLDRAYKNIVRENFFKRLVDTDKNGRRTFSYKGREFMRHLRTAALTIEPEIPREAMSPTMRVLVELVSTIIGPIKLEGFEVWAKKDFDDLKIFVSEAQEVFKNKAFIKVRAAFCHLYRKNLRSLTKRLTKINNSQDRVLVLRLDLSYEHEYRELLEKNDVLFHFERFIKEVQELTYIYWARKLEYGVKKGYHIHFLLVLDMKHHYRGITICEKLGQYWREQATKNEGRYWNCNRDEKRYHNRGIGVIHTNSQGFENLKMYAAPYLVKNDYYFKFLDDGRSFTQSKVRGVSEDKSGLDKPESTLVS